MSSLHILGPPPPYSSIAQTVTAQPQPLNATFVPFQPTPEPKMTKLNRCCQSFCAPCVLFAHICGCLAEVCFAMCDCREI